MHQEQGLAKSRSQGLVNFVTALAYHIYLALPAAFTQPGDHLLPEHCSLNAQSIELKLSHPILELDDSHFPIFIPGYQNVFFCYVQMSIMSVMTKCF